MPNIIEQQDLLKGLPDSRLALLMQKPDASIPPFLVAAEAQRRQSIRQQFAGDGSKESVVDTLTKQLANVPQNIQAPMQTPPQMPAPQAGIGALQQGMAGGGPVRRFAGAGFVAPTVGGLASDITSMTEEEYLRKAQEERTKALGPGKARYLLENPVIPKTEAQKAEENFRATTEGPGKYFSTDKDRYAAAKEIADIAKRTAASNAKIDQNINTDVDVSDYNIETPDIPLPEKRRDETASTSDSSPENRDKAESAAYRKRIEELYGVGESSNWEEAQKWFAMASAIMEPGQNLMQGIAGAGQIYAQAESEEAAARRRDEAELQRALLQYDIGERDYGRQVAAQNQTNRLEAMKYQAGAALKEAELYRKAADDAGDALNRQISALAAGGAMQEDIAKDPTVVALQERITKANEKLKSATIRAQGFNTLFGNMYGLPAGFEASDGESFFNIGG